VLNLPNVFKPNVDGPWIDADAANTEATIAVITKCPSGALRFRPEGTTPAEGAPGVNTIRVWEDGPLAVHAELNVGGNTSSHRATLCRCGKSFNKPYCDKMHEKSGFKATGEPESGEAETLAVKNGPLNVTPTKDGPLHVEGALEVCSASGRTITRSMETWLCRCGHSKNKPFCDGSHEAAGFKADGV
jgi:CDGSH-type Zn-finger protein